MPTMGKLKFFLRRFERAVRGAVLSCADFVRLGFAREEDARLFDVCFATMYIFMLIAASHSYNLRFGSAGLRTAEVTTLRAPLQKMRSTAVARMLRQLAAYYVSSREQYMRGSFSP